MAMSGVSANCTMQIATANIYVRLTLFLGANEQPFQLSYEVIRGWRSICGHKGSIVHWTVNTHFADSCESCPSQ